MGRRGLLVTLLPSLGATDEEVRSIRRALPPAELFWIRTLRVHPTEHPTAVLREEAEGVGAVDLRTAGSPGFGAGPVRVAGVVAASRRTGWHGGGVVHFMTLRMRRGSWRSWCRRPS